MGKLFSIVKSSKERVDPLSGDKAVMQTGAVTLLTSHLEGDLEGGRDERCWAMVAKNHPVKPAEKAGPAWLSSGGDSGLPAQGLGSEPWLGN